MFIILLQMHFIKEIHVFIVKLSTAYYFSYDLVLVSGSLNSTWASFHRFQQSAL